MSLERRRRKFFGRPMVNVSKKSLRFASFVWGLKSLSAMEELLEDELRKGLSC